MFSILISSTGLSPFSVLTFSMLRTTSAPFDTRPNTVCLLSNHGVGTVVMKNCGSTTIADWGRRAQASLTSR